MLVKVYTVLEGIDGISRFVSEEDYKKLEKVNKGLIDKIDAITKTPAEETFTLIYTKVVGGELQEFIERGLLRTEFNTKYGEESDIWVKFSLNKEVK